MKDLIKQSREILNEAGVKAKAGMVVYLLEYEPSDGRTQSMGLYSSERAAIKGAKEAIEDAKTWGGNYHMSNFTIQYSTVK